MKSLMLIALKIIELQKKFCDIYSKFVQYFVNKSSIFVPILINGKNCVQLLRKQLVQLLILLSKPQLILNTT